MDVCRGRRGSGRDGVPGVLVTEAYDLVAGDGWAGVLGCGRHIDSRSISFWLFGVISSVSGGVVLVCGGGIVTVGSEGSRVAGVSVGRGGVLMIVGVGGLVPRVFEVFLRYLLFLSVSLPEPSMWIPY